MKLTDKIIGVVGLLALLFSLFYYSITNIWEIVNWVTLALGIAGSGYFLYMYFKHREKSFSVRSLQYGSNVMLQVAIVLVIAVFVAILSSNQHLRFDWTENQLYSLADQTEKILSSLETDVKATAFFKARDAEGPSDILDEYRFLSDRFEFEFVDPDEKPQIARKYAIQKINSIVVESGNKREIVEELTEANLTNAIMKVTREQDKVIYFLTGHGERSITDDGPEGLQLAAEGLRNENHIVRELNLVRRIGEGRGVPDSCTVLAIINPRSTFFPTELDSIKKYIDSGGKALIMIDPEHQNDIVDFMSDYAVDVGDNIVVDNSGMGRLFGLGVAVPLVTGYDSSIPITKDFNVMTFYPLACSITPREDKGGYDIKTLLKTSPNSWAETDYKNEAVRPDEGRDIMGPVSIAVTIEKSVGGKKMGMAVIGDSDFARNGYWKNQGNADLFLNIVNYLAEEEDQISIRPKDVDDRRVTLTSADVKTVFYLVVIIIPLLVIIGGIVFYIKRGK